MNQVKIFRQDNAGTPEARLALALPRVGHSFEKFWLAFFLHFLMETKAPVVHR